MNWKLVAICILIGAVIATPMISGYETQDNYDDALEVWQHRYGEAAYNASYDLDGSGDIVSTDVSIAYIEGLE